MGLPCRAPHPVTVMLKLAVDQSGGVDERSLLKSKRFTDSESLDAAHRLRRDLNAVLIGVETVIRDDPSLTVRRVELQEDTQPLRVVLDRTLRIPRECALLTDNKAKTVIMYSTLCTLESRVRDFEDEMRETGVTLMGIGSLTDFNDEHYSARCGVDMFDLPLLLSQSGIMPPLLILDELQSLGIRCVLLEGGPFTARAFLAEGLVARAIIIRAPVRFTSPWPSGIDSEALRAAGLEPQGSVHWGADVAECWSLSTEVIGPWPYGGVGLWP